MIRNGSLVHGLPQNPLLVWRPSNDAAYGLLTGFLTTVLSYQIAAIVVELCMGLKRSGRCKVQDIGVMLLVRSFSPVAVLYSLFPTLRDIRTDERNLNSNESSNATESLQFPYVFKLAFLLTVIPLINMATIVFNLESTTFLTAKDAKFGGLSFGVNPSLSTQPFRRSSNNCTRAIFKTGQGEDDMATFLNCDTQATTAVVPPRDWSIDVFVQRANVVSVLVTSPTARVGSDRRPLVLVRGVGLVDQNDKRNGVFTRYQLKVQMTNRSAEMLVDFGFQIVKKICEKRVTQKPFRITTLLYLPLHEGRAASRKLSNCNVADPDDAETGGAQKIVEELSNRLTFIESARFEIAALSDTTETSISGDDLLLLRRNRSYVSVPILGIVTSAVVVLRILVGFVTSNDVETGIGLIVRQGLGLRCLDSILPSRHVSANYEDEREVRRRRSDKL